MARTIEFEINVDANYKSVEDLKKEIASLEKEFETVSIGSKRFDELGQTIKKSRSQLKDIELQFEALDKEQKAAALVDTFSGLAGAIGAVSGAFIAFGAESEAIEEAEKKLLGIIAVVQGIREVSDAYIASIKLFGPALKNFGGAITTAFKSGTKSVQIFKASLATIGIGALIIAVDLLIENWDKVSSALGFAADEQKVYNEALIEAEAGVQGQIYDLNTYNAIVQDVTASEGDRTFALEQLNKLGVNTEDITLNNVEALDELNSRIKTQTTLIVARAKAEAAASLLQDALEKQLKVQSSTLEDNIGFWGKAQAAIMSTFGAPGLGYEFNKIIIASKNQVEDLADATVEVDRAASVYQSTLEALLPLEAENASTQTLVKERLERRSVAEKALTQTVAERAKAEQEAASIVATIVDELSILRADESEKEIIRIQQSYADRLALLKQVYGEESTEVKALLALQDAEITEVRTQQATDAAAQTKELLGQINEAVAVSQEELRDLERTNLATYYNDLILAAQEAGISTVELESAKLEKLKQLNDSYREEDDAANQVDVDKQRAFRQQLTDLAIDSGLQLISSLSTLNSIYDKDNEAAAKKSFQRQKALSMVETIISTYSAAQKAYASQFVPVPDPSSPVRGQIAAGVAIAGGLAKLAVISKQKFQSSGTPSTPSGGGGGGGGGSAGPSSLLTAPQGGTPSTGLFGGLNIPTSSTPQQASGNINDQPLRAYVLAGDVTNGQEANAKINNIRKL